MAYIYMDESGDLGAFENWGSQYFIITFLVSKSEKDMEIIMKNVRKRAAWSKMKIYWTFFHSNNLSKKVIKRCLDLTSRRDIFVVSIIADKTKIPFDLKNNIHYLYNFLVWELLSVCQKRNLIPSWEKITFIASRRETNKNLNKNFITTLQHYHSEQVWMEIKIISPKESNGLEVVDTISYAIYKKYEENNLEFYSLVKNKILLEKVYHQNFN